MKILSLSRQPRNDRHLQYQPLLLQLQTIVDQVPAVFLCPWGCVSLHVFYKHQGHSVPRLPGELPHSRQAKGQTAGVRSNFSREFISSVGSTPENYVPQSISFCVFEVSQENTVAGVSVLWAPGCIWTLGLTHLSARATLGRIPVPGSVQERNMCGIWYFGP